MHTYLGLLAALVISVVCLTGALLAFEPEIERALHPERYEVEVGAERLPLDALLASVRARAPQVGLRSVTVHAAPDRSVELDVGRRHRHFVDPYTGAYLGHYHFKDTVFFQVFSLHRWLLAGDVGKAIVGASTLIFLVVLVSGVVVWWPRTRRGWRARLTFKRGASGKRKVFDLHVVLGIYAALLLFVMGFTGLAWSFRWFHEGIYAVTGSPLEPPPPPRSQPAAGAAPLTLTPLWQHAQAALDDAQPASTTLILPREPDEPVAVRVVPVDAPHDRARDTLYLDAYSGALLQRAPHAERSLGARVRASFYPLHVGSMFGWPGRILAFVACLIGATLPITGALIWFNKRAPAWRRRRRAPINTQE